MTAVVVVVEVVMMVAVEGEEAATIVVAAARPLVTIATLSFLFSSLVTVGKTTAGQVSCIGSFVML